MFIRFKKNLIQSIFIFGMGLVLGFILTIISEFSRNDMMTGRINVQGINMPPFFYFGMAVMGLLFLIAAVKLIQAAFSFFIEVRHDRVVRARHFDEDIEGERRAVETANTYNDGEFYDPATA